MAGMNRLGRSGMVGVVLVGFASSLMSAEADRNERADSGGAASKPFFAKPILLGAHRGGKGLWPENTLVAFRECAKRFPNALIETDARLTADGAVVLMHDRTVDRTTNGTGEVAALTLAEIQALDAGHDFTPDGGATYPYRGTGVRVPTLREALEALPAAHWLIELKGDPELADAAIAIIREANADQRVMLASFIPATMERARERAPELPYCYDANSGLAMLMALRGGRWADYTPVCEVLSLDESMFARYNLTPEELRAVQGKGVKLQFHTINDPDKMREYLAMGVDSILTDRPDLLEAAIGESGDAGSAQASR